jgi:hypothetical protein
MTPRSLWIILLRIMGIWFVLNSVQIIYQYFAYMPLLKGATTIGIILAMLGMTTLVFLLYFLILYICIFRTDWIIDKLKLDKGFMEEKFELNIHRSTIYHISLVVIGGLLLLKSFPKLCRELILYFQQSSLPVDYSSNPTWSFVFLHFVETLIGIYFITSSRTIINFIENQRRKSIKEK